MSLSRRVELWRHGEIIGYRNTGDRLVRPWVGSVGYWVVGLCKDGKSTTVTLHRLLAFAFLGEPPSKEHEVNHIDGNKLNCGLENLEWVTPSENRRHAIAAGLWDQSYKRNKPTAISKAVIGRPINGDPPMWFPSKRAAASKFHQKPKASTLTYAIEKRSVAFGCMWEFSDI